jgi:hypothetical protein
LSWWALPVLVLALSCARSEPRARTDGVQAPGASAAPPNAGSSVGSAGTARTEARVITKGEPYAFVLAGGVLGFCDQRGGRQVDLETGQDTAAARACGKIDEANPACSGLGLDVAVRSPHDEPNDIVDVDAQSFPLRGRAHDCAADGRVLALATASEVLLIDTARGAAKKLDAQGGDRVAIGSGWIAWSTGSALRAARRAVSP